MEQVNAMQLEGGGQASKLHFNFLSRIWDGLHSDPHAVTLMQSKKARHDDFGANRDLSTQKGIEFMFLEQTI